MRAELRGLPANLALAVGAHLVAAGGLVDDDPELAYAHAEAARRRAARLPIVREATAETAYAAGHYAVALNEFRALRRMTGGVEYTAVMADCERALGRPEAALRLVEEARNTPGFPADPTQATELLLVEAGARADRGQRQEALRLLKAGINHESGPTESRARLRYAYADMLLAAGDERSAREWFEAAAALDPEGNLDAEDRLAELDGLRIELDLDDDLDDDLDEDTDQDDRDGDADDAADHDETQDADDDPRIEDAAAHVPDEPAELDVAAGDPALADAAVDDELLGSDPADEDAADDDNDEHDNAEDDNAEDDNADEDAADQGSARPGVADSDSQE